MKRINKGLLPKNFNQIKVSLPMPQAYKDLLIGSSVFGEKDRKILDSLNGYFAIEKKDKNPLDVLNDKLGLYLEVGNNFYLTYVK